MGDIQINVLPSLIQKTLPSRTPLAVDSCWFMEEDISVIN